MEVSVYRLLRLRVLFNSMKKRPLWFRFNPVGGAYKIHTCQAQISKASLLSDSPRIRSLRCIHLWRLHHGGSLSQFSRIFPPSSVGRKISSCICAAFVPMFQIPHAKMPHNYCRYGSTLDPQHKKQLKKLHYAIALRRHRRLMGGRARRQEGGWRGGRSSDEALGGWRVRGACVTLNKKHPARYNVVAQRSKIEYSLVKTSFITAIEKKNLHMLHNHKTVHLSTSFQ